LSLLSVTKAPPFMIDFASGQMQLRALVGRQS